MACGESFHIALEAREILEQDATQYEDFIVYYLATVEKTEDTIIYVGNHPQPDGIELQTGKDWPSIVKVHGSQDIADRITISDDKPEGCLSPVLREG